MNEIRMNDDRRAGNLILDYWVENDLFLNRLLWYLRDMEVKRFGCTLYEVKNGKLIRSIDYYIEHKHLDYNNKFGFEFKEHESKKYRDKIFTEFYYQSIFKYDSCEKI
jgi:hypothetical protein